MPRSKLLLIFDLDGTLIDSSKDLTVSVNATLSHFGLPNLDESVIHSYVGNGAAVLVRRSLGSHATDELASEALTYFLRYYRRHALENTRLYPGIRESLDELRQERHLLAVLTNKPARISIDILNALGLGEHFFRVYGGDNFGDRKKPDPVGIHQLRAEAGAKLEDSWMIGDSSVDVQTARNAGVLCCGVAWGFQPESFRDFPPDRVIFHPRELLAAIPSPLQSTSDPASLP